MKARILNVDLVQKTPEEIKRLVVSWLSRGAESYQIVTPNPEILLLGEADDNYQYIIDKADLKLVDGFGLILAARLQGVRLNRITGSNITPWFLKLALKQKLKIALILKRGGLTTKQELEKSLAKNYPELNYRIWELSPKESVPSDLVSYMPHIALIGLGAPYQDEFAYQLKCSGLARISVGVGGSLDFVSGKVKRAPKIMRASGLEWLWRLLLQPRTRIKRIWRAVFVFLWEFIKQEYGHRGKYRPNVVGFILNSKEQVLIINSAKEIRDFWKLPQGGRNPKETEEAAIQREMTEELSLDNLEILAKHSKAYRYDWPPGYSISGYKGQEQTLFILRFSGQDNDIKLNNENRDYAWVPVNDLLESTDKVTHRAYKIFLEKYNQWKYEQNQT